MALEYGSNHDLETNYYLIMEGTSSSTKPFRLQANQVVSIGRSSTNRIVLSDEKCSRNHCEVLASPAGWKLRDRDSRNGTYINGEIVDKDHPLTDGDLIRIGTTVLLFSSSPDTPILPAGSLTERDTAMDMRVVSDEPSPHEILYRQRHTSYSDETNSSRTRNHRPTRDMSRLVQMAMELRSAESPQELADLVLDGLVGITGADIGAVLTSENLAPVDQKERDVLSRLEISSYRSLRGKEYRRVSRSLSQQVFHTYDAILARDLSASMELAHSRDSLADLQAESVIVAPLLDGDEFYGLIHLYSTKSERPLEAAALDYTLAAADQAAIALKNLRERMNLQAGLQRLETANEQVSIESELIGKSPAMQRLRDTIGLVATTDTVALIRGESGAGKELVARAIHMNSSRRKGPFVCMNCAALSESLLESELFGHEKGSFTGATGQKHGKFEQADGGTLFLDEVGEMSPAIQAKFLRVLEGHAFERVGGATEIKVDVRLVAATNRNLEQAVREMTFRKDLYFRLQVLEIHVPPLRDRKEDVPLLAQFFAERVAEKSNRKVRGFSSSAMDKLMKYDWPGNVRELQNTIERAVVLCPHEFVDASQVQLSKLESKSSAPTASPRRDDRYTELSIEDLEKEHILRTLEQTQGNKSRAAQILGIERSTLDRKLKKYGLKVPRD
ncbi:MAG: sigma 54-interacting transcriptional regulator [Rubinisphaera brasiliensis]|uniref:sigma 54-interacting transcriptional regulator n=1 Tax=Rubinisphaera brasiliensis TaxID=119 RepID=UPI0039189DDF